MRFVFHQRATSRSAAAESGRSGARHLGLRSGKLIAWAAGPSREKSSSSTALDVGGVQRRLALAAQLLVLSGAGGCAAHAARVLPRSAAVTCTPAPTCTRAPIACLTRGDVAHANSPRLSARWAAAAEEAAPAEAPATGGSGGASSSTAGSGVSLAPFLDNDYSLMVPAKYKYYETVIEVVGESGCDRPPGLPVSPPAHSALGHGPGCMPQGAPAGHARR